MPFFGMLSNSRDGRVDQVYPTSIDKKVLPFLGADPGAPKPQLAPLHRLPVLIAELGLQAAQCRRRGKRLEPEKLTSTLKARARALGESKDFKNAKLVLLDWAEVASSNQPGRNDNIT